MYIQRNYLAGVANVEPRESKLIDKLEIMARYAAPFVTFASLIVSFYTIQKLRKDL